MERKKRTESVVKEVTDSKFKLFIASQSPNTARTYLSHIRKLCEFTGKSGTQVLRLNWTQQIFIFKNWLTEQGYSSYYVEACLGCLRGYLSFYGKQLNFSPAQRRRLMARDRITEDYSFSKEDIKRMVTVGNLKEKYVLLCGISFGLRAEDFSRITFSTYRTVDINGESPVDLGKYRTSKEHVSAHPFISSDAQPVIRAVLETFKNAGDSDRVFTARSSQLSEIVRNLAKKSGVDPHGKLIRFHILRKYLYDRLCSGMSDDKAKQIIGKSVSESAYLNDSSLRECYQRAMPNIVVLGNGNGELRKEVTETKTTVDQLVKMLAEKDNQLGEQHLILLGLQDLFKEQINEKARREQNLPSTTEVDTTAYVLDHARRLQEQKKKEE